METTAVVQEHGPSPALERAAIPATQGLHADSDDAGVMLPPIREKGLIMPETGRYCTVALELRIAYKRHQWPEVVDEDANVAVSPRIKDGDQRAAERRTYGYTQQPMC